DLINPVQIENYYLLQPLLPGNERVTIHLMSHRFQYQFDPYADCLPGRRYRFTYLERGMVDEWSKSACVGAEAIYFPLSMDFTRRPLVAGSLHIRPPYRIGVFIRFSTERPFSGILAAFRKLRDEVDAELWLYGRGDPALLEPDLIA